MLRATQLLGLGFDVAVHDAHLRPHLLQTLQVQVDGTAADGAATRCRNAGAPEARHQRPQGEEGGTHRFDEIVLRLEADQPLGLDAHFAVDLLDGSPQVGQQAQRRADVDHHRDVAKGTALRCQQRRQQDRQRGVLRPVERHLAPEAPAAVNADPVHALAQRSRNTRGGKWKTGNRKPETGNR